MDQKIGIYLESLISETLNTPAFVNLPEEQKNTLADKIRDRFCNIIFDLIVDRLNVEQLSEIKDLPMTSPEMANKIQEFAAFMPDLAQEMETKLNQVTASIKQNPQILYEDA